MKSPVHGEEKMAVKVVEINSEKIVFKTTYS
jgi:hypothetical protein